VNGPRACRTSNPTVPGRSEEVANVPLALVRERASGRHSHGGAAKRRHGTASGAAAGFLFALPFVAILSAGLWYWFATTRFLPELPFQSMIDSYDAYRYDLLARILARWPFEQILQERIRAVHDAGYVRFLAILYSGIAPDALLGCFVNWLLWLGAGLLLTPVAAGGQHEARKTRAVFLSVWLLLPDAVDWTGTTSKEPLCAFILALCLRLACAVERASLPRASLLAIAVAVLALLGAEVRTAISILAILPFALATEMRVRESRFPWTLAAAALLVATIFLGFAGDALQAITDTDFSATGYAHAVETWGGGFSQNSVLLRIGSQNKWLDLLVVPVRGLAHIISPLNASPLALPLAQVSAPSLLQWLSAAIYTILAIAIALRAREHFADGAPPIPARDVVLLGTSLMAVLLLGLTGIIHERYRSILVPAFLPLGVRHVVEETAAHGMRRIGLAALGLAMFSMVGYLGLKYAF
jgi:hypothetical protein